VVDINRKAVLFAGAKVRPNAVYYLELQKIRKAVSGLFCNSQDKIEPNTAEK
jgi:hypothetical protein